MLTFSPGVFPEGWPRSRPLPRQTLLLLQLGRKCPPPGTSLPRSYLLLKLKGEIFALANICVCIVLQTSGSLICFHRPENDLIAFLNEMENNKLRSLVLWGQCPYNKLKPFNSMGKCRSPSKKPILSTFERIFFVNSHGTHREHIHIFAFYLFLHYFPILNYILKNVKLFEKFSFDTIKELLVKKGLTCCSQ